jgi:cytochrome P450
MQDKATLSIFPPHVPAHLRWDHSLAQFNSELDDPFLAASRLHEGPPVIWARDAVQGRPGWVIVKAEYLEEAFIDWENFSSEGGMDLTAMLGVNWKLNPVNVDPPMHTAYRKILTPLFTPKVINHMEVAVRETCDRLISRFQHGNDCDFVQDFSIPFPSYIFVSLMGMPVDMVEQFFGWEQALLRGETMEERLAAGRQVLAYLEKHLAEQRKQPATALMEAIVGAELGDRPLDDGEILGMFMTFYLGGLDTVYATLSWSMRHIATHPEYQQFIRDNPDMLSKVVDEYLRMFSVVSTQRRVARDCNFHGVEMKKDDLVVMPIFIACRDPVLPQSPRSGVQTEKPAACLRQRAASVPWYAPCPPRAEDRHRNLPLTLQCDPYPRRTIIRIPRGTDSDDEPPSHRLGVLGQAPRDRLEIPSTGRRSDRPNQPPPFPFVRRHGPAWRLGYRSCRIFGTRLSGRWRAAAAGRVHHGWPSAPASTALDQLAPQPPAASGSDLSIWRR